MKMRERIAWSMAAVFCMVAVGGFWSTKITQRETGKLIMECALDMKAAEELCSETDLLMMRQGVQIFECEENICAINGWTKPEDYGEQEAHWQDVAKELRRDGV